MGLSIWHLIVVLVIALIIFGTKKLRNVGGDLGGAIRNFKQSMKEGEEEPPAADKDKPAEQVFKNIQLLKGAPAGRLLAIMEFGYSRSLGVTCTHCHTSGAWEKEDLNTKQIARDMAAMTKTINEQSLKNIKNLKGARPTVNCATCHRGQTTPALNLPENKPKM